MPAISYARPKASRSECPRGTTARPNGYEDIDAGVSRSVAEGLDGNAAPSQAPEDPRPRSGSAPPDLAGDPLYARVRREPPPVPQRNYVYYTDVTITRPEVESTRPGSTGRPVVYSPVTVAADGTVRVADAPVPVPVEVKTILLDDQTRLVGAVQDGGAYNSRPLFRVTPDERQALNAGNLQIRIVDGQTFEELAPSAYVLVTDSGSSGPRPSRWTRPLAPPGTASSTEALEAVPTGRVVTTPAPPSTSRLAAPRPARGPKPPTARPIRVIDGRAVPVQGPLRLGGRW